ncbi:MAG: hypothetical protein RLZZ511_3635 [Cyanobacteriota bacterium]
MFAAFGDGLDDSFDLGELFDIVADLFVEDAPIGDDDDGVEDGLGVVAVGEFDELVGKPGDGVAFAGTSGVLNQVALLDAMVFGVSEEGADEVELVVAGKDEFVALPAVVSRLFDDLGVFFEDVAEAGFGEDVCPKVVGLDAVGVDGVACAVVVALVEGEEDGVFAFEVGAHVNEVFVEGKVDEAAGKAEEGFFGITIVLVLADCVLDGLFGEVVF